MQTSYNLECMCQSFIILMNVANDEDFLPQNFLIAVLMKCFNLEDIIFACYSLMNNDTLEQKVNMMGYIRAVWGMLSRCLQSKTVRYCCVWVISNAQDAVIQGSRSFFYSALGVVLLWEEMCKSSVVPLQFITAHSIVAWYWLFLGEF